MNNTKKKTIGHIGEVIGYIAITLVLCFLLQELTIPKYMSHPYEGAMMQEYYKAETRHDVIFLGDCEFYETISPVLAQLLAWEYWWEHWLLNRDYEEIPLPAPDTLGMDSARAYIGRNRMTHVVLQKGGILCHVYGFRGGMASLTVPELAAAMAASLQ